MFASLRKCSGYWNFNHLDKYLLLLQLNSTWGHALLPPLLLLFVCLFVCLLACCSFCDCFPRTGSDKKNRQGDQTWRPDADGKLVWNFCSFARKAVPWLLSSGSSPTKLNRQGHTCLAFCWQFHKEGQPPASHLRARNQRIWLAHQKAKSSSLTNWFL